ncbi:hypothetical protein BY996DRAFT_7513939 [Phakopsora pachyrhizi]|uniref:Uncharacterized protein n=1 Tax=Phakopsora pachyrhizi TaxID=170000 RepID=A0AAV0BC65_PHAPC|nr:hypothetical protein BY996DRAFT_7813229 [Phakopsora pachyrhizi]KAI8449128.1 hypothetical protein BY996DRAFT_7513939 [Phakopsora pachyrhizi]CAH7684898.1 hypothetical protein PPACK8108_LOCUS19336 [Phakopsora pachyrhizi]
MSASVAMHPTSSNQNQNQILINHQQQLSNSPLPPAPIDTSSNSVSTQSPSNPSSTTNPSNFSSSTAGTSPLAYYSSRDQVNSNVYNSINTNNPNSTTRILILSDFNKDLKTRDIQLIFANWEDERGGFKIKWIDDTSCLIVFADPGVAKRAFLNVLSNPPPSISNIGPGGDGSSAKLRPYNGPDVLHILASVQNRPRSRSNASQSLHSRASSLASNNPNSGLSNGGLGRRPSMGAITTRHRTSLSAAAGVPRATQVSGLVAGAGVPIGSLGGQSNSAQDRADQISNQPSMNPLLNSHGSYPNPSNSRPSTANSEENGGAGSSPVGVVVGSGGRARIDDAGKRFLAAGLGKSASSINHMAISELGDPSNSASYSLTNLTIEEEATTPTASSH